VTSNGFQCKPWDGACANGRPVAQDSRSANAQCKDCGAGFFLEAKACRPCAAGYFSAANNRAAACTPYGGACQNGALVLPQAARDSNNHCGSCEGGYQLVDNACVPFAGRCAKGALIAQNKRDQKDHCGSCTAGHKLVDKACVPCGTDEFQDDPESTAGSCQACPNVDAAACGAEAARVGTGCSAETGAGYTCTKYADVAPTECGPGQERVGLTTASVKAEADLGYKCVSCVNGKTFKPGTNPDACQTCQNIECGGGTVRSGSCSGPNDGFICEACPTNQYKKGTNSDLECDKCDYKDGDGQVGCKAEQYLSGTCTGETNGFQCNTCRNIECPKGYAARSAQFKGMAVKSIRFCLPICTYAPWGAC